MSTYHRGVWHACGTGTLTMAGPVEGCAASAEAGSCLPLQLPRPCRRLAVKDAEGAA